MLRDSITGEMREVDIVAKATVGSYDLFISVECRDHKRSADVTWVESMAKKHESLPTSKLVLWSRSGFTKAATAKALALKIETVSQANANDASWATIARRLVGGSVQLLSPRFSPFIDVTLPDGTPFRLEDVGAAQIYDRNGKAVQSVPAIIGFMRGSSELGSILLDHAPVGSGDFYAEIKPPVPWFADDPGGNRLPIRRVGVGVSTLVEREPVDTVSAVTEGKVSTLATAQTSTGRFELYVEESTDGTRLIDARHRPRE